MWDDVTLSLRRLMGPYWRLLRSQAHAVDTFQNRPENVPQLHRFHIYIPCHFFILLVWPRCQAESLAQRLGDSPIRARTTKIYSSYSVSSSSGINDSTTLYLYSLSQLQSISYNTVGLEIHKRRTLHGQSWTLILKLERLERRLSFSNACDSSLSLPLVRRPSKLDHILLPCWITSPSSIVCHSSA